VFPLSGTWESMAANHARSQSPIVFAALGLIDYHGFLRKISHPFSGGRGPDDVQFVSFEVEGFIKENPGLNRLICNRLILKKDN
jgi:hypothetical protein